MAGARVARDARTSCSGRPAAPSAILLLPGRPRHPRGSRSSRRRCREPRTSVLTIAAGGILAAGEGSRLRRDGWTVAKPLVPVGGVPLIEHAIENLLAAGSRRIAILFNEDGGGLRAVRAGAVSRAATSTSLSRNDGRPPLETFRELSRRLPPGPALFSTVDAWCPREDFVRFAREASRVSATRRCSPSRRFVDDERPLWVRARDGDRAA